jgi:hypothetical protein
MNSPDVELTVLGDRLAAVLDRGLSADPLQHAEQVAEIASVLFRLSSPWAPGALSSQAGV